MTSAAQAAGCVSAVSVLETGRDCTPSLRKTRSEPRPRLRPASVASYSCSHWPSCCCFSDDGPPPLPPIRLWSLDYGTMGWTKRGFGGRELELNFAKKKNNEKDLLGEWMDIFFNREEQKIKVQYSLFCFADIWICRSLGVICPCGDLLSWFQWILVMRIVGRRRRRERRKRDWWWWWRWWLIDTLSGPFTTSFQSQWNSV